MLQDVKKFLDALHAKLYTATRRDTQEQTAAISAALESVRPPESVKVSELPPELADALAAVAEFGEKVSTADLHGEKGDPGENGVTPESGKDYFTNGEVQDFLKRATPVKGEHYFDGAKGDPGDPGYTPQKNVDYCDGLPGEPGKPGSDGSPDTGQQVVSKLTSLSGDDRLHVSSLRGLNEFGSSFLGQAKALVPRSLSALYDVSAASPLDGQVLAYQQSSEKWIPSTAATGGGSALWSGIGNPTSNLALTMGAYSTQWSYTGGGLIFFSPTGQIGIGTAAPANALDVGNSAAGQNVAIYQTANGAQLAPALTTPNWTMTSGWVYGTSPNVLNKSGTRASSVHPASALPIVAGNTYQVTITASAVTVGSFNYSLGGNISNNFGVPGTYTSTFLAVSTASLSIASVGSTSGFVISAVSVIQVFANTGNLTLGNNILSSSGVQAIGVAANGDVTLYGNSGNYSGGELQLNSGNNPYFIHASNQVQFVAGVQSSGGGSQFAMAGGNSVIAGQQGGAFVNIGGGGYGSGAGGSLQYTGGGGGATGPGGYVNIAGGDGGNTSGDAGSVGISGGAVTNGNGGGVYIFGSGGAGGTNQGGDVVILPGSTSGSGRIGQLQFFNSDLSSYYTWLDLSQVDLGAGNLQVTYPELNVSGDAAGTLMLGNTGRLTAKTSAQATVQTLTVPATDSSYLVSANANVTAFVAGTFNVVCAYTDETNTPRSLSLNFSSITGTLGIAVAAAGAFEGVPVHVRAKAGTTVTISTSGTFTSLTYNVEGNITPISTS